MAEDGIVAAGENRSHPSSFVIDGRATDRVNPAPDSVQPTDGDPVLDRIRRETQLQELPARDHPVLLTDQAPHLASFGRHSAHKSPGGQSSPPCREPEGSPSPDTPRFCPPRGSLPAPR